MTYSIVARDPDTGELGAAVQSRWFAVGAGVLWAEPGVGAVATQSFALIAHGRNGLAGLREGRDAAGVLAGLLASDAGEATRQVGIVDARGGSAAHTGSRCVSAAGHLTRPNLSIQANMMERPTVWPAMLAAFATASGDLTDRLLASLRAAEAEGGDVRGRQSAALLVVPSGDGADASDRRFDVRVDDDRAPLDELARLVRLSRAYEALGNAEDLLEVGDPAEAESAIAAAYALAPEDDQIALYRAAALVRAGREVEAREVFAAAVTAEPRAGEHLRRFAAAGHLPDHERILAVLGI